MKTFRKKWLIRPFSVLGIILMFNNLIYPTVAFGLTSGPHQPEYTAYEDASSSDMVNLLTGDFTFTMPILSVPAGNEGSFTVPLSYHAGIAPQQEASFIGLGFGINLGSITRNINGFPDDANGETQTVNVKDLTGRRGWYSNFLGWSMGWDSQAGHYGAISLGLLSGSWTNSGTTVGLGGVYVGENGRVDPAEVGMTIIRIVGAVATQGTSEFATTIAMDVVSDFMQQAAMASSFSPPQSPTTKGNWQYSSQRDKKLLGLYTNYWYWLNETRIEDMFGTLYLDQPTSTAFNGGPFNPYFATLKMNVNGTNQALMQFPQSTDLTTKGAASDISINISSSAEYKDLASPTFLAYDNYHVNGPGISGSITPYRFEVGSVSVPREMTLGHTRLNPIPFLSYANKVPFVYEGAAQNRYYNHVGATSSASVTNPAFYYGLNSVRENSTPLLTNPDQDILRYDLNDVIFKNDQRIRSDISTARRLPQGNFIDWLSNGEIRTAAGKFNNTSYMDYFPSTTRAAFRSTYRFGGRQEFYGVSATGGSTTSTIVLSSGQNVAAAMAPLDVVDINVMLYTKDVYGKVVYMTTTSHTGVVLDAVSASQIVIRKPGISVTNGAGHIEIISKNQPKKDHIIGGFVITSVDGMNYHYSLPIYDYGFKNQTTDKTDANKNSFIERKGQFANTWLLTAITGPDFVDRGGTNNAGDGYIDENDWGYWVKFNYGTHSTDYKWSFPYSTNGSGTTTITSDDNYKVYAEGFKEKYYINSVETRSHVAIFIKDSRRDAKDASTSKKPSLRLAEIALLTKDSYKQLTNPATAVPNRLSNCSGTIDVSYQVSATSSATGYPSDNSVNGSKAAFIQANAIKRIVFNNNDYSLCAGATNSDAGYGKLTLKSISVFGKGSTKILPDYKFSYGNNPAYHADKWDGWGMYSSTGTNAGNTHKTSNVDADGAAWALTELTNPLGSKMVITYGRDTYSSISGERTLGSFYGYGSTNPFYYPSDFPDVKKLFIPPGGNFSLNEKVRISGSVSYTCPDNSNHVTNYVKDDMKIVEIGSNYIKFETPYVTISNCNVTTSGTSIPISNSGNVYKYSDKKGGNVRVASIQLVDPSGQSYKTRYLYEKGDGFSSGVVSQEPDYIRANDNEYVFYSWSDYPATPVMYGQVTVLSGKLTSDSDYTTKTVYEFETPHKSQYVVNNTPKIKDKEQVGYFEYHDSGGSIYYLNDYTSLSKFEIENRTSKIGKLKSVKTFDKAGTLYTSQDYEYSETMHNAGANNYQGTFSEGSIIHELVETRGAYDFHRYHKAQRTTVLKYPWTLNKITSTIDGHTFETTNTSYDLFTGAALESQAKSPLGTVIKTVHDPLYKVTATGYSEFGSKAENPANLNMLSQIAAKYVYKVDDAGKETGLIEATANVWKKSWDNYRILDANNVYKDDPETSGRQIWRKNVSYVWKGDYFKMNADGTSKFTAADKFDYTTGANSKWQVAGSYDRFNHNSVLLESKDLNNVYSSRKMGYNDQLLLASATNAMFSEIAYSGAEDRLSPTSLYFGGEVALKSGSIVSTPVHTGQKALSVSSGANVYGFVFKTTGAVVGKPYRASVWANNVNGRIYYKIGPSGVENTPTPTISSAVLINGVNWYRLDLTIDGPAVTSSTLEVGIKSNSGTVVFDDFRFQPFDAVMTGFVYNPTTQAVEYTLGDDNTYTRYQYNNDTGVLEKTYQESLSYGEKLLNETKQNYRRFSVDQ